MSGGVGVGILSRLLLKWSLLGTKNLHTSLEEGQMMWETQVGYSLWKVLVPGIQRHLTLQEHPEARGQVQLSSPIFLCTVRVKLSHSTLLAISHRLGVQKIPDSPVLVAPALLSQGHDTTWVLCG